MTTRPIVRYALVLLGGFLAGGRLTAAIQAWRDWHTWATSDPSLADFHRTEFWLQVGATGLSLASTYIAWWLLRPRPAREPGDHAG